MSTGDVHVVVVGGGFGGISAALQLKSRGLAFTLIDMRDSFHHNVAGLRASLQPGNDISYPQLVIVSYNFSLFSLNLSFFSLHFKVFLYYTFVFLF